MRKHIKSTTVILTSLIVFPFSAIAQVPQMINYQGRVAVNGKNFHGIGQFKFSLVDAGPTHYVTFWSNDGTATNGEPPSKSVSLPVDKGIYSVLLGDATLSNMTAISSSVFTNANVSLRVWFEDGTHGWQQFSPDQRIAAVGYAMMAATAQSVPDASITSSKIAPGAIESSHLGSGSVGAANIATGSITGDLIAPGTIRTSNLAARSIGDDQLIKPPRSGTIPSSSIQFFDFDKGTFSVSFSPPFATPPIVTLSVGSNPRMLAAGPTLFLTNQTSSGFSGLIFLTSPGLNKVCIDPSPATHPSLRLISGHPAISYRSTTPTGTLKFIRANDALGESWGTAATVDSSSTVGGYTSLSVINGNPAISYYDYGQQDLKYVRSTDSNGTWWSSPITVDATANRGEYTSMATVNNNPAISYADSSQQDLMYVRANSIDGSSWGTPISVHTNGNVGRYTSLAIANGNPAISYMQYDTVPKCLFYVRANDSNGTSWGQPVLIDSSGLVGEYTSLAIVNGNPAICYRDYSKHTLRYVRANDANGTSWGMSITLDPDSDESGFYTSLAVVDGKPAISYRDGSAFDVRYTIAEDLNGAFWRRPVTIDTTDANGTSLDLVGGEPSIACSRTTTGLWFIRKSNPSITINWVAIEP